MNPNQILNIGLSMLVLILYIVITIRIFKRMKETKLRNLRWLIIFYAAQTIIGFTQMMYFIIGFYVIQIIILLSLILFTRDTFYKERQSAFIPIFISAIILLSFDFTFVIIRLIAQSMGDLDTYNAFYILDMYMLSISTILASLWYASASFSAYRMAKEQKFDEITTLRYKVLGVSAIFYAGLGFIYPIHATINSFYRHQMEVQIFTSMTVALSLIFALGNYYSWIVLGKKIKKLKETLPSEEELSEEEIAKMFKEEA